MCHRREFNPLDPPSRLEGVWGTQPSPAGGLGETPNDRIARSKPSPTVLAIPSRNLHKYGSLNPHFHLAHRRLNQPAASATLVKNQYQYLDASIQQREPDDETGSLHQRLPSLPHAD
jgi:hypothetical protein